MNLSSSCLGCGKCCKAIPCQIAIWTIGYFVPCKALEFEDGRHWCGMIRNPSKYVDLGPPAEWKDRFLGNEIKNLLGIGRGCDSDLS
jgi:hypothetical protein